MPSFPPLKTIRKTRQKEIKWELDRTDKNNKQETPLEIPTTKGVIKLTRTI